MALMIGASIDLSKIDKSKIIEGKNGGKYYDVTIIVNDTVNTFGQDVSISEKQSKQEVESKTAKKYLGNGRVFWKDGHKVEKQEPAQAQTKQPVDNSVIDDLPF